MGEREDHLAWLDGTMRELVRYMDYMERGGELSEAQTRAWERMRAQAMEFVELPDEEE